MFIGGAFAVMNTNFFFENLLRERADGHPSGIYSVCSANPIVIEASINQAQADGRPLLIEATSNQVNQYGGYTGMKPKDFAAFVRDIAVRSNFDPENLILGGDHLGPLVWKHMRSEDAMLRAEELVTGYVTAGFTKIHIDTSMKLADDPTGLTLPDELIAERGARLCAAAEGASSSFPPVYVIGSEVPAPGGASEKDDTLAPTEPPAFKASYDAFRSAFGRKGLENAFSRIVAFVVQPGVEFSGDTVFDYDRDTAATLCASLSDIPHPHPLFFEGHSTDYQRPQSLAMMVEDGIGILKVGPGLTFALREGLMALEHIERELAGSHDFLLSNFMDTLDDVMQTDDSYWKNHYHGDEKSLKLQRRYSLFDRARYYLPTRSVEKAVNRLLSNLERAKIGLPLLSQYLPRSFEKVRRGELEISPGALLKDCVRNALAPYSEACFRR